MKKLLMLRMLLSSLSFACPDKTTHDGVQKLIGMGYAKIEGKKLIVDGLKLGVAASVVSMVTKKI